MFSSKILPSTPLSTPLSSPGQLGRAARPSPSRLAFSRRSKRIHAVDTTKANSSVARELAQARGSSGSGKRGGNGKFRLATDKVAADFEAWAERAGIVAPKLRIADFDGKKVAEIWNYW